jgi:hypothetical protein
VPASPLAPPLVLPRRIVLGPRGWCLVTALLVLAGLPAHPLGLGPFIGELGRALALDTAALALAFLLATGLALPFFPLCGRALDRYGARGPAVLALGCLALALVGLSQADRLASISGGSGAALGVLVLLLVLARISAQGVLQLLGNVLLGARLPPGHGGLYAVNASLVCIGQAALPAGVAAALAAGLGWRSLWLGAALGLLTLTPLFWRWLPSALEARVGTAEAGASSAEPMPLGRWLLVTAILAHAWLVLAALGFHGDVIASAVGLAPAAYYGLLALGLPAQIAGAALAAHGFARADLRPAFAAILLVSALAGLVLSGLPGRGAAGLFALSSGLLVGAAGPALCLAYPMLFGPAALGARLGTVSAVLTLAAALGPWLMTSLASACGGFPAAFACVSAATLAPALALWRCPLPTRSALRLAPADQEGLLRL